MNVLILSCGTGEGHNSAGRAMREYLVKYGNDCTMLDVLSFKSEKSRKRITLLYSQAIKKTPALFGLCYRIGGAYDKSRLPSPIYAYHARYAQKLDAYIREKSFDCVICAHLFAMEAMTAVRKKYKNFVKCYGILTDYTAIPFYKDTALDGYFAPDKNTVSELCKTGIPANKIFCTGIPVSDKFSAPYDRREARRRLHIPQDKKVCVVASGGAGCGKVVKLCAELLKNAGNDRLVIAFSGKNGRLADKLNSKFKKDKRFMCVPFTLDIDLYFKCADVILTKPGGLSSTETAVLNVPLVHLKAIPGCETANMKYFTENGMSLKGNTVKRAALATESLLSDDNLSGRMRIRQNALIRKNSSRLIADIVSFGVDNGNFSMDNVYSMGICFGQCDVLQSCTEADLP